MTPQAQAVDDKGTDVVLYDQALWPELLDQDPDEVMARFAARFVAADSIDDLFDVLEGNTTAKMVGRRIELRDAKWAPYESDRGIIPNAICTATDLDTGEVVEFATTGQMLVMFIRRAQLIGALPFKAKITSRKTRSGQNALNFERA